MPAWLTPLLYYAASMLYIYMTYALSQSQTPPLWFGTDAAERSVRLWLYTNSLVAGGFLLFAVHRGGVGVFSWARKHLLLVTAAGTLAIFSSMGTTASLPALCLLMLTAGYFAGGAHYVCRRRPLCQCHDHPRPFPWKVSGRCHHADRFDSVSALIRRQGRIRVSAHAGAALSVFSCLPLIYSA